MTALSRIDNVPTINTEHEVWENLRRYAEAARGAFSPNTERAIRADVAIYTAWCEQADLQAMPGSSDTVGTFVDAMAATKAPATVRRYVSSISTFHRAAEMPNPCETQTVKLALKRMHREVGRAQQQAAPLNDVLVERMLRAASRGTLRNLRNKSLLVVAYTTMMRRSELVALLFADLQLQADGGGTVSIMRSKSDQEGVGAIAPVTPDAMRHLQAWIDAAAIEDGPLFRAIRKGSRIMPGPLGANDVALVFKGMARAARLSVDEIARISGHSARVGAAQDMLRFGEQLPSIMQAGRWRSAEMVGRYTAKQAARDGAADRIAHRRVQF